MSRIGKRPIEVPVGRHRHRSIPAASPCHGPKGELRQQVPARMPIAQDEGTLTVTRPTERGEDRALHGLTRTLVANMVEGVTNGFEKKLEIQGVGYRATLSRHRPRARSSATRTRSGSSRAQGIEFEVPVPTQVVVRGIDKQLVGQTAAEIRKVGRRSRTRARASATRASSSAGRSASGHEHSHCPRGTSAPASPRARQGRGTAERPRLAVFRSNRGVFAQLDRRRHRASTLAGRVAGSICRSRSRAPRPSRRRGRQASRGLPRKKAGIESVVFDRGGYLYHGRVKALADGAREGGLIF